MVYANLTNLGRHEYVAGVGNGIAKCPFDPEDNSTAVWVENGNPGKMNYLYFRVVYRDNPFIHKKNWPDIYIPIIHDFQISIYLFVLLPPHYIRPRHGYLLKNSTDYFNEGF